MKQSQNIISKSIYEKRKATKQNGFKSVLFISVSIVVSFFLLIILFLGFNGISGFVEFAELNFNYFISGTYYDLYNGILPGGLLVINTIWTALLAVLVAVPISVMAALFITRIAPKKLKPLLFAMIVLLASVPSVIYGSFGLGFIDSIINEAFKVQGAIITIVFTLAIMIIPTITLITITSINNVDKKMESSSLALGATRMQTNYKITLKAINTGILTGTILGIGRALGEASAVSMVASESSSLPVFGLFDHTRLLTTSMLKGFGEVTPGSVEQSYMFSLGLILIITVMLVFASLKKFQSSTDPEIISINQSKKANELNYIYRTVEKPGGIRKLNKKQLKIYKDIEIMKIYSQKYDQVFEKDMRTNEILSKSSIKINNESQKIRNSKILTIWTMLFALLGLSSLIGIITYLFIDGANYISWDFLTTSGKFETLYGVDIYGLRVPLFGTLISIIMTLAFAIPLGISGGLYFAEFAKKNKINKVLITGVELLTAVPSLIFGLVGTMLFLPFATKINLGPLASSLTMTFMVVPTIIKTTEESINSINSEIKKGSLALGATKSTTSLKISIPQAIPGILSGVLLSIGRILGESAALVMIFGVWSKGSFGEWMSEGGTTLATEIYRLTGDFKQLPWEAIKAIGIIIMILIFVLSILSHFIQEREWNYVFTSSIGIVLMLISIFTGVFALLALGAIIFIMPVFIEIFLSFIKTVKRGSLSIKLPIRLELILLNIKGGR